MFSRITRLKTLKIVLLCTTGSFLLALILSSMPVLNEIETKKSRSHKLVVIVPFRNRFEELLLFVPHMYKFLSKQKINFKIAVINQHDNHRFNRASLINAGFDLVKNDCDYIAMHDVDLLPLNDKISYKYPQKDIQHLSGPEIHPKYHYSTFVGGVLLMNNENFQRVNGMSNRYWGWGLEDDEFYLRLSEARLNIIRPKNIGTGKSDSFSDIHDSAKRKRDYAKIFNQREETRKRDRATGLSTVQYKLIGTHQLSIDGFPVSIYNVELHCDHKLTPWCDFPLLKAQKTSTKEKNLG